MEINQPEEPRGLGVLLTHGAGGDARGPGLTALARGLAARGYLVVRFNLPYRAAGARIPPAERSVGGFVDAFEQTRAWAGDRPLAVGGKSYGGRVASLAVAAGLGAAGLVFYGYPLHPPGRPEQLRTAHWPQIRVPCLFLQGTHDPFCRLDLLKEQLALLSGPCRLHVVEGGDHSLAVPASRSRTGDAQTAGSVLAGLEDVVADWLAAI